MISQRTIMKEFEHLMDKGYTNWSLNFFFFRVFFHCYGGKEINLGLCFFLSRFFSV